MRVSEKTTENSERLGRQARPGFEPGTSRLPVLSVTAEPLVGPEYQGFDVTSRKGRILVTVTNNNCTFDAILIRLINPVFVFGVKCITIYEMYFVYSYLYCK